MAEILVSEEVIGRGHGRRLESHVAVANQGPLLTLPCDGDAALTARQSRTALILRLSRQGVALHTIAKRIGWSLPVVSRALKEGLAEAVANRIADAEQYRSLLSMRLDETVRQLSTIAAGKPQLTDYRQALKTAERIAKQEQLHLIAQHTGDLEQPVPKLPPIVITTPSISEQIAANRAIAQITMQQAELHGLRKHTDPTDDEKARQFMRLLRGEIDAAGNVIKPAKVIDVQSDSTAMADNQAQPAAGTVESAAGQTGGGRGWAG